MSDRELIQVNDEPPFTLFEGDEPILISGERFEGDVVFAGPPVVCMTGCSIVDGSVSFYNCHASVLGSSFFSDNKEIGAILACGGSLGVILSTFTGFQHAVCLDGYPGTFGFDNNTVDYCKCGIVGDEVRYMKATITNNTFHTADQAILLGGEGMTKASVVENNLVAYSKQRFPNAPQDNEMAVDGQTPLIRMRELSANNVVRNNVMQPKGETWHGCFE